MQQGRAPLVVDTHNHFWHIERSDLYWLRPEQTLFQRSFTPPDLQPEFDAVGVDRAVIVQAAKSRWDNLWYLRLAEQYDYIGAVIGWVDLDAPADVVGAALDEYCQHRAFRGVRATAENVDKVDWLAQPAVRAALSEVARRGLVLDLLVRTPHLPYVPRLAEEFPQLPLVIDHLAKPALASGDLDGWRRGMAALARYPNIWCKVSGLLTEAGPAPSVERIRPAVQFARDTFGLERLLWGSDWPVCLLAADYQTTFRTVREAFGPLTAVERAAVFGGNAVRCYRLEE